MSKRARHQPGFYATSHNDVCDRACNLEYRPKVKPTVMGIYEVERIFAKRVRGGKAEYFIQWQNYCPSENTWEPAEHLPQDCRIAGSPYLASEEELIAAGLGPYLMKCLTVTGGGCRVDTPVYLKLFIGKSLSFLDEQGRKTASRPVERVQIKSMKSYFAGRIQ